MRTEARMSFAEDGDCAPADKDSNKEAAKTNNKAAGDQHGRRWFPFAGTSRFVISLSFLIRAQSLTRVCLLTASD